jgi:hypothetical protein
MERHSVREASLGSTEERPPRWVRNGSQYRPTPRPTPQATAPIHSFCTLRGAAAALVVGWLRPAPWLLVAILSAVWSFAVNRFLRADAWGHP